METEELTSELRELSGYFKTKRKHFWVRRFIILKSGILYYYKNATATVPRGIIHLDDAVISKDNKELVIDISKANLISLKIQFPSLNEFTLWHQYLSVSLKGSEKSAGSRCAYLDQQKNTEKENLQLIEQIPKSSMQGPILQKIKEIVERDYKITGTRGYSTFACAHKGLLEVPEPKRDKMLTLLCQLALWELIRYLLGDTVALLSALLYLGYYFSMSNVPTDKPVVDNKFHFRCTVLIKSGLGEILTALYDTYCRQAWEPYLSDCTEATSIRLAYSFKSATLVQEISRCFIKDSSHFYLLEKAGVEIKNLFKIEAKNKRGEMQCLVSHYGCLNSAQSPLVGNAEILSCLKTYVESTTVYVSTTEVPHIEVDSDEDDLNHSMSAMLESGNAFYNSEAMRVLKEAEALLEEQEGWEDLKLKSKLVKGYRRKAAGGLFVIKGEGEINRTPLEIVEALKDIEKKGGYDSMFECGHVVETVSESTEVVYQKYKSKGPVSARDFCMLQKRFEYPGGKVVAVATSITHAQCPETKFVRANLFMGCHFLTPTGPNSTLDVYMVYVDIRGSVPKFIINSVQNDQAMLVENLRNYLG